jgi:hypothetical protein
MHGQHNRICSVLQQVNKNKTILRNLENGLKGLEICHNIIYAKWQKKFFPLSTNSQTNILKNLYIPLVELIEFSKRWL